MTSVNPNERAADGRATPGVDPVHPAPRPKITAVAERLDHPQAAADSPRPASALGTPAVLEHRVVALEPGSGSKPLIVHTAEGERAVMPLEARVWARAGRLTVIAHDGTEMKMTVLGAQEAEGLRLGDHWPLGEPESRGKRVVSAAAREVGDVLTFPAWLARTTRISGQRNTAMHALIRQIRKASPDTAVFIGQTFGFEHHRPEYEHPYDHRGPLGREGYPKEL